MKHSAFTRIISFILVTSMILSMVSGCASHKPSESITGESIIDDATINTEAIVETIIDELMDDNIQEDCQPLMLSANWEDYVGDIETFVYGLLTYQLESCYDVFPAYLELSDGAEISGLAYSDYSECYTTEDETQVYFSAGFLRFPGEDPIPREEFECGLVVHNLDYEDENNRFLLKYATDEFTEHCVVFGQYVKYGANSSGQISFSAEPYVRGQCDELLGSLYSYDESRYVMDLSFGQYSPISGVSLASRIDYDQLEAQINKILEAQEINYAQVDIETNLYFSREAVESYLLSLQEETFCGYSVDALIEATQELDPMECFQLSPEGILTIDINKLPGEGATPLAKWLVGATCLIVTAVGLVGSTVFMMCPVLSAASGAITGVAIDVFMQVVVSGQALSDVNWNKVVLSAVTGAVSGLLGPYIMATTGGAGYFFADSAVDAVLGGIERTVTAWLDGADGLAMIKSFGYGFALGFALSAGFKGAGELVNRLGRGIGMAANEIAPKLTATVCEKFSDAAKEFLVPIGNALAKLQKAADGSIFYSKYIANAIAFRQLARLVDDGVDDLADRAFDNLAKNGLVDADGNPLTKEALRKLFNNAKDGEVIAQLVKGKDVINVVKQNGIVGIVFDPDQYITVNISRITDDRDINFEKAAEKIKEVWVEDPVTMPAAISTAIREQGKTIKTIKAEELVNIIQTRSNGFVLHENIDMQTITLVPRTLHDTIEGGFSHMGGVALAKHVKAHMGSAYFERILAAASTGLATAG